LFSATFRYALLSLHEIAAADTSLKAAEIAALHNIPISYLNNVLFELRRLGFVTSKTGSRGGYQLALPPQEINLLRLHQGLAGAAGLDRQGAAGALLWLHQIEDRWLDELERTSLTDVQLANVMSPGHTINSDSLDSCYSQFPKP
jgi:Rrf2 family protein